MMPGSALATMLAIVTAAGAGAIGPGAGSALTLGSGLVLGLAMTPGAALRLRSGSSLGSDCAAASEGVQHKTKVLWVRSCLDLLKASSMPSVSSATSPLVSQRHSVSRQRTPVGFEPRLVTRSLPSTSSTCACERWMVSSTAPSWPRLSRPRSVKPGCSLIVPVSPVGTSWYIRAVMGSLARAQVWG